MHSASAASVYSQPAIDPTVSHTNNTVWKQVFLIVVTVQCTEKRKSTQRQMVRPSLVSDRLRCIEYTHKLKIVHNFRLTHFSICSTATVSFEIRRFSTPVCTVVV